MRVMNLIRSCIAVSEQRANKLMLSVAGTISALCQSGGSRRNVSEVLSSLSWIDVCLCHELMSK